MTGAIPVTPLSAATKDPLMTEFTTSLPDIEPEILRAVDLVVQMRTQHMVQDGLDPADADDPAAGQDQFGAADDREDGGDVDEPADDEQEALARDLGHLLSAAEPGSVQQAALTLALSWLGGTGDEWNWEESEALVLRSLPVEHPHWALWSEQGGLGPATFMSLIGPPCGDAPSVSEVSACAYTAEVAQRHPDPRTRQHADAALALHAALRRTLGEPAEERHADLEALVREVYSDRPDQVDLLLPQIPDMLFDPEAFLREYPPGSPAPDFSLQLLNGTKVTLADFAGSPVLVYFTGSWCSPCQVETPAVVQLHAKWAERGVRFLGVAMEETPDGFGEYLAAKGVTWPFGVVGENDAVLQAFKVEAFPTLVVLGPHGTVLAGGTLRAAQEPEVIEALFEQGLSEVSGPPPEHPSPPAGQVTAAAVVAANVSGSTRLQGGLVRLDLGVEVQPPWKVYPPGSAEGMPLRLAPGPAGDTELVEWSVVGPVAGSLSGRFSIDATVRPGLEGWQLELVTQACSGAVCQTPRRLTLAGVA